MFRKTVGAFALITMSIIILTFYGSQRVIIDFRIPDYLLDQGKGLELDLQDFLNCMRDDEFEFVLLGGPGRIDSGRYIFDNSPFPSKDISDFGVRDVSIMAIGTSGLKTIGNFRIAVVWIMGSYPYLHLDFILSRALEEFPLQEIVLSFSEKMIEGKTYLVELCIPNEFSYELGEEITRRVRIMYEAVVKSPDKPEEWLFSEFTGLEEESFGKEWMDNAKEFIKPSRYAQLLAEANVVDADIELWGEGFLVVPYLGNGYQTISRGLIGGSYDTKWGWLVTPIVSETHKMHVNVHLVVYYRCFRVPKKLSISSKDIDIEVQESIFYRLKRAFQRLEVWIIALFAAVFVPIVTLIHRRNLKLKQIRLSDSTSRQNRRWPFPQSFYTEKKMRKRHKNHHIVRKH